MAWINTGSASLAGIGTIVIAAIGVWGVFFTDIPERLIGQLRSDITEAQERLVTLEKERRTLAGRNESAQAELERLDAELQQASTDLASLRVSREKLRGEVEDLQLQRKAYVNTLTRIVVNEFIAVLEKSLAQYQDDAQMAAMFPDYLAWVHKDEQFEREEFRTKTEYAARFRDRISEHIGELHDIGRGWRDAEMSKWYRGEDGKDASSWSREKAIAEFRASVTLKPGGKLETGQALVDEGLASSPFSRMLTQDDQVIRKRIKDFVHTRIRIFSTPIVVRLPRDSSPKQLAAEGRRVEENIRRVRQSLDLMRNEFMAEYAN
jgi:flagellar biosynthesis chaperone FliJ